MTETNIEAGLCRLSRCVRETRTILAWEDLARAEARPGTPPSFRAGNHTDEDLRFQRGLFSKVSAEVHTALRKSQKAGVSEKTLSFWKVRLLRIDLEFATLGLTDRFIRP